MVINGIEFLTTEEAAEALGLSPGYLKKCRHRRRGPTPFLVGRAVLYTRASIERERARRVVLSRG